MKTAATPCDRNAGTMVSATGLLLQGRIEEGLAQLLSLKKWALADGWRYSASGVDFAAGPALAATGRISEGVRMLEEGIAACGANGCRAMATWNRMGLANPLCSDARLEGATIAQIRFVKLGRHSCGC
jgi:hypothetical protein